VAQGAGVDDPAAAPFPAAQETVALERADELDDDERNAFGALDQARDHGLGDVGGLVEQAADQRRGVAGRERCEVAAMMMARVRAPGGARLREADAREQTDP